MSAKLTTPSHALAALLWNKGWYGAVVSPISAPGALYETHLESSKAVARFTLLDGAPALPWGAYEELEIIRLLPWPLGKTLEIPLSGLDLFNPASYCAGFVAGLVGLKGAPPDFATSRDVWRAGNTAGSERRQAEAQLAGEAEQ